MKIKVFTLFIILWGITNLLKAQLTPLFETTLYVEDAIVNRDTVMFGFDPMATSDIDEDFGEVALNTPFDSILEARFTSADNDILSKPSLYVILFSYGTSTSTVDGHRTVKLRGYSH